jgi:hypothetical protein
MQYVRAKYTRPFRYELGCKDITLFYYLTSAGKKNSNDEIIAKKIIRRLS